MKNYMGVWIDHKKAFLVTFMGDKEITTFFEPNVEGRVRLSGGSCSRTPYGSQEVASERKRDERQRRCLREYYKRISDELKDAHRCLIFGPGEAKIQLEKEMRQSKQLSHRIVTVALADKMTKKTSAEEKTSLALGH